MSEPINILIVEDCPLDAELAIRELELAGFQPSWKRVETEEDFLANLTPDVELVIADYELPRFSGLRALQLINQRDQEIPLIMISGVIGEDIAVSTIKLGAFDYILKDRMARLSSAVRQGLDQARLKNACRKAEEAALQGEHRFRMLFEAAHDAVYIMENGVFVDCNPAGQFMYGRTRDQILGHTPDEFAPPTQPDGRNSREKAAEIVMKCLSGEPQVFEWTSLHKDGSLVSTDVSLNRMELGHRVYMLAIARDTTERKRAEAKIAEQADFLDKARDAIVVRGLDGVILFWNMGAERLYGWTREEVLGRNVLEVLGTPPERFSEVNEITAKQGEWTGELEHSTKDGRTIIAEVRCSLIRDESGNPKSLISINTDVTEKKKIESQFLRAQRMESIGALAGGVAHDLNNILAPILMSIVILKKITDNPQAKEILDAVGSSAKRGADIVRQLLSFARGLEGRRTEVQADQLLRNLDPVLRETFPKNIRLQLKLRDEIWPVFGDPTQIEQILLNLCLNARDAMPMGGTLTVGLENCILDESYAATHVDSKSGRYVRVNVSDTGMGMPRDVIDRIFEPFFTTKDLNKGTGLGLSTVMAIVKSHEGIINVYSELGKGSSFTVFLPAALKNGQCARPKTENLALPRGHGETVLVVDDEASILAVTSHTLEAFGYRALTATDGAEAVAIYEKMEDKIAAVLTDMAMPIMDGPATINALIKINPDIKIIASSGLAPSENVGLVPDHTRNFLAKPYTAEDLLKTVRRTLDETNGISNNRHD